MPRGAVVATAIAGTSPNGIPREIEEMLLKAMRQVAFNQHLQVTEYGLRELAHAAWLAIPRDRMKVEQQPGKPSRRQQATRLDTVDADMMPVLRCIDAGLTLVEISEVCGLNHYEVDSAVAKLKTAFGTRHRAVMLERARSMGVIPDDLPRPVFQKRSTEESDG